MKRTYKWLGNLMIVASLLLLLTLAIGHLQSKRTHNDLLTAFESVKAEAADNRSDFNEQKELTHEKSERFHEIEGVLSIPLIDLKSPVLLGADASNLSQALGAIVNMDKPGEMDGSYAIAGHQSQVFGAYFNRLDELEIGNHFTYETVEGSMRFEVFDVNIVKPQQVDVLDKQDGIALLSLITCYPANSNEYRLVVQAKRID